MKYASLNFKYDNLMSINGFELDSNTRLIVHCVIAKLSLLTILYQYVHFDLQVFSDWNLQSNRRQAGRNGRYKG